MIATSVIKDGLFLISWSVENLNLKLRVVEVNVSNFTCYLSFRKGLVGHALCLSAFQKTEDDPAIPVEIQSVAVTKDETKQQKMKKFKFPHVNRKTGQTTCWFWSASWPFSETLSTPPISLFSKLEIVIDTHFNCPELLKIRNRLETIHQVVSLFRENQAFGQVMTFHCENKTIKGHPSVLATLSPVFSAMFKHEFKEKQEKLIKIEDVKANIFEQLVQYFYIQDINLENLEDISELLVAADKYYVDSLKEKCGLYLSKNLSFENATRCLILAHRHQVPDLKEAALIFIEKHAKSICDEDENWLELAKNYPELIVDFTKRMAITCIFLLSSKLHVP